MRDLNHPVAAKICNQNVAPTVNINDGRTIKRGVAYTRQYTYTVTEFHRNCSIRRWFLYIFDIIIIIVYRSTTIGAICIFVFVP